MRFRESYPDHPGLLLLRSITEMICKNPNEINAKADLLSSLKFSIEKYSINPSDMPNVLEWLLNFSEKYNSELTLLICCAFLESIYKTSLFDDLSVKRSMINAIDQNKAEESQISSMIYQLSDLKDNTASVANQLKLALKDQELISMLN